MRFSCILSFVTLLFAAALLSLAPLAAAELIQTDEVVAESRAKTDRERVQEFMDRASVTERLKALGVQDALLKSRVGSLTDEEVRVLAGKIDALPAGGAMTDYQLLIVILLIAILVAIIV
jgi:hypothetical protein